MTSPPSGDGTLELCEQLVRDYNALGLRLLESNEIEQSYEMLKKAELLTEPSSNLAARPVARLKLRAITFNNLGEYMFTLLSFEFIHPSIVSSTVALCPPIPFALAFLDCSGHLHTYQPVVVFPSFPPSPVSSQSVNTFISYPFAPSVPSSTLPPSLLPDLLSRSLHLSLLQTLPDRKSVV